MMMKERIKFSTVSKLALTATAITLAVSSSFHREDSTTEDSQVFGRDSSPPIVYDYGPPVTGQVESPSQEQGESPQEFLITPDPTSIKTPSSSLETSFKATHYGESYNGQPLGCGTGEYSSDNPEILAVSPSRYQEWPCGTRLRITNPANSAILEVVRHDACPGCGHNTIDLSEKGLDILCGQQGCSALSGLIIEEI